MILNNTHGGEELNPHNTEVFRFSLDVFNNDERWRAADKHFEYMGNFLEARIWEFHGTYDQFVIELNKFNLQATGGFRSDPKWNDGNWIYVCLKYCP